MASTPKEAIDIAKTNAGNEILSFGRGNATKIFSLNDIPEDWKDIIPYSSCNEIRKCKDIVGEEKDNDVEEIIKVKEGIKKETPKEEKMPETRPDPKPKEMEWQRDKPLPKLRYL